MRKFIVSLGCVFILVSSLFGLSIDDYTSYTEKFNFLKTLSLSEAITQLKGSEFSKTISIEKLSEFEKVLAGKNFTKQAKARLTIKNGETVSVLSNIDVLVKYPIQQANLTYFTFEKLTTDENGILTFSLEALNFPVLTNVVFCLLPWAEFESGSFIEGDLNELCEIVDALPANGLESITCSFPVKVSGKKKNGLKTTIDIVDFNEHGQAFSRNMVATSLLGEFMTRGYLWPGIYESSLLKKYGVDFEAAVEAAKPAFGGNINEYIVGQSRISWKEQGEGYVCTCSAKIQVWDMSLQTLITEFTASASLEAKKKNSDTEMQARQKLGKTALADFFEFNFEFR